MPHRAHRVHEQCDALEPVGAAGAEHRQTQSGCGEPVLV